jgi:hypothetical protein
MTIQTFLRKHNFSRRLTHSGTEYWTGYAPKLGKDITIRISNHDPSYSFIDDNGEVQQRDETDYRIDPEQDDTEKIKALFPKEKNKYVYVICTAYKANSLVLIAFDEKNMKEEDVLSYITNLGYDIVFYRFVTRLEYKEFLKRHNNKHLIYLDE